MEKKHDNTELIAFRVNKRLKAKLDDYCTAQGQGIAAVMRCWISNLPDDPTSRPTTDGASGARRQRRPGRGEEGEAA